MKYQFNVAMACDGCKNAIDRVLTRLGVEDKSISVEKQEVIVTTDKPYELVEQTIKKTGKEVRSGKVLE
ncbi:Metal homeostasis factor atx1 [Schizosaccharomyces pombe]|uniref:Metal homeostasis factor atx1 n=1 Tax=Schizosaccharomyces pombe (strain 972 / ATCC 24843) TaxID=284812 RepID=ATX1_SCHPO|nr:Cu chaperone Atx1 [Schizosaccharomyces pombe]O74735.1 RecName: Full=Metal homeostasis factor atx1 [Schizosaccharomyces pombe 972h-]CAA21249.1 copper chaperone Atx1 [Schizosaccharomyces pombe]|eukprot:NP_595443.1 Cu chaperone Atx1 [Schizosaccharomyces pombe]